jgi:outer membrane protein TolC
MFSIRNVLYTRLKLARLQNIVTLYEALGGGWNEHDRRHDGQ